MSAPLNRVNEARGSPQTADTGNVQKREKSVKKREKRSFLGKNGRFGGKTVILGAVFMKNFGSKCPTELFCFRRVMIPAKIKGFWFEVSGKRRICLNYMPLIHPPNTLSYSRKWFFPDARYIFLDELKRKNYQF